MAKMYISELEIETKKFIQFLNERGMAEISKSLIFTMNRPPMICNLLSCTREVF